MIWLAEHWLKFILPNMNADGKSLVAHQWPPSPASPMGSAHASFINDFSGIVNDGLWEWKWDFGLQVLCGNFLLWSCYIFCCLMSGASPMEATLPMISQVCKADGSFSDLQRFHYITFKKFWENSHINISTLYKDLMTCVLGTDQKRKEKPNLWMCDHQPNATESFIHQSPVGFDSIKIQTMCVNMQWGWATNLLASF